MSAVTAVETVVPVLPSQVVLPPAGSGVATGQLSFLVAVLAAAVTFPVAWLWRRARQAGAAR